jgi:hypothetical protein
MGRYNCYCARWCALCTLVTRPKDSMFMFPKAFAVARSATTDVPHTPSIPSARTSRRYLPGAFMASGGLHGSALHLLRAYAPRISLTANRSDQGQLGQLAIPTSPPYAICARPSLAQGTPKRPLRKVNSFFTRLQRGAKGRVC